MMRSVNPERLDSRAMSGMTPGIVDISDQYSIPAIPHFFERCRLGWRLTSDFIDTDVLGLLARCTHRFGTRNSMISPQLIAQVPSSMISPQLIAQVPRIGVLYSTPGLALLSMQVHATPGWRRSGCDKPNQEISRLSTHPSATSTRAKQWTFCHKGSCWNLVCNISCWNFGTYEATHPWGR
ncbi:hypothetical protein BDN72DRAFT_319260 [Pluteus cervinus]|uniref:Uncharacterized protein n=1 Tax=Pluteus cervinus TaxID=181527 RepID=A0ACD3ACR9_9AGAR|nr:hypothetical protein BDN72DRAFT_319260 [Pluteus cervinus]